MQIKLPGIKPLYLSMFLSLMAGLFLVPVLFPLVFCQNFF
jgi:hypothetical protein